MIWPPPTVIYQLASVNILSTTCQPSSVISLPIPQSHDLLKPFNLQVATDNGASPGTYTVTIKFIVDVAGNVSDVKALSSVGFGMEQEAVRVVKKSGKWNPGIQNGREVKSYHKLPITFTVK